MMAFSKIWDNDKKGVKARELPKKEARSTKRKRPLGQDLPIKQEQPIFGTRKDDK